VKLETALAWLSRTKAPENTKTGLKFQHQHGTMYATKKRLCDIVLITRAVQITVFSRLSAASD